jgi:hypothetical protein
MTHDASWSNASSSLNEPETNLTPSLSCCHRPVGDLGEILVLPVPAGEADERETRREQAAVGQVVDGWHQLLARQVARDAEHDEDAGPGHAGDAPVSRIAERITRFGHLMQSLDDARVRRG